jgi:hypothetical protein
MTRADQHLFYSDRSIFNADVQDTVLNGAMCLISFMQYCDNVTSSSHLYMINIIR